MKASFKTYREIKPKWHEALEDRGSGDTHGRTSDIGFPHITPSGPVGAPPEAYGPANPIDGFLGRLEETEPIGHFQNSRAPLQVGLTYSHSTAFDVNPIIAVEAHCHASTGPVDLYDLDFGKLRAQNYAQDLRPELFYTDYSGERDPTFNLGSLYPLGRPGLITEPTDVLNDRTWYPLPSATSQIDGDYEVARGYQYENFKTCTRQDPMQDSCPTWDQNMDSSFTEVAVLPQLQKSATLAPTHKSDEPWSTEKMLQEYNTSLPPYTTGIPSLGRTSASSLPSDVFHHADTSAPGLAFSHTSKELNIMNALNTHSGRDLNISPPIISPARSKASSSYLVLAEADRVEMTEKWTRCMFTGCEATFEGKRTCDRKHNYTRHFKSIHLNDTKKQYKCQSCPKTDSRKDNLRRHERAKHPRLPSATQPTPRRRRK